MDKQTTGASPAPWAKWPAHPAEKSGSYELHPAMAAALAPFAPPSSSVHARAGAGLNDDDLYLVHVVSKRIVARYGCSSVMAAAARRNGMNVAVGHALVTGMQARSFGVVA